MGGPHSATSQIWRVPVREQEGVQVLWTHETVISLAAVMKM